MNNLSIIAAIGNKFELGFKNQLLCHLPVDLKRFKNITTNATIIMGANTWNSLPKKPLPLRRNIVMVYEENINFPEAETIHSLEAAMQAVETEKEAFIIGGASIYNLFIDKVDKLYLTRIHANFEADVFFPSVDFSQWNLIEDLFVPKDEQNIYDLQFQTYIRKSLSFF
jgi:dihydrofolate reductase